MEKKNNKVLLEIIGIAILLVSVIGLSFAFFNYTRTGQANTLKTGNINFNSTQDNTISLTNVFPTSKTNLNSSNSDTATITITGDTTYSEGIEYKVTLDQVNNTINGKEVPVSIKATASNLGTESSNYYTDRENKTKIYMLNSEGEAYNGKYIAVGYIPEGSTGVNGSIDITAFIDTNKVAISDTYDGTESELMGTTNDWVMGREVFTTTEWNSFQNNSLSFKVKVEANEGIWIEKEKFLTMKNLNNITDWTNIRANITSIEFHKDGIVPANSVTSFDVTDTSSDPSKGPITLYTVDDGLGNGTYKAIVVANDTIYAPENCYGMFVLMTNLVTFNSKNFKVDNVSNMNFMFFRCTNLVDISSLSIWDTSNVQNMAQMFWRCSSLVSLNGLANWNTLNVTTLFLTFSECSNLVDISGLTNWNTSNVTTLQFTFSNCSNLVNISGLANWNVEKVSTFNQTFSLTKIENVDALFKWRFNDYTNFVAMFENCTNLRNLNGLKNWNVAMIQWMTGMFNNCTNLEDATGINNWDINAGADFTTMFYNTPVHPEFTKFPNGTWADDGTFTPNA